MVSNQTWTIYSQDYTTGVILRRFTCKTN